MDITDTDIVDHIVRLDARYIGTDSTGRYVLAEFDEDGSFVGQQRFTPEEYCEWGSVDVVERCCTLIDICTSLLDRSEGTCEGGVDGVFVAGVLSRVRAMVLEQAQATKRVTGLWLDAIMRNGA